MKILVGTLLGALFAQSLFALDFGADYPVLPPQPDRPGFYAGFAEQYTYFNDTQLNGFHVWNSSGMAIPLGDQ